MATYDDMTTVEGVFAPDERLLAEFASHVDAATATGVGDARATIHSYGATGALLSIFLPPVLSDGEAS